MQQATGGRVSKVSSCRGAAIALNPEILVKLEPGSFILNPQAPHRVITPQPPGMGFQAGVWGCPLLEGVTGFACIIAWSGCLWVGRWGSHQRLPRLPPHAQTSSLKQPVERKAYKSRPVYGINKLLGPQPADG